MKTMFLILALLLGVNASALQPFNAKCVAYGDRVGGNDLGVFVSDSVLDLFVISESAGVVTASITGNVKVASRAVHGVQKPEELNAENAYIGDFACERMLSNPDYRPIKYAGYTQFKGFDAVETSGLESGMWGYFLIGPDYATAQRFHGVYVFQAGDHMGGTLHFTCTTQ